MWTCSSIKKEGWNRLKKHFGGALLLTLLFFIAILLTELPNEISGYISGQNTQMLSAISKSGAVTSEEINKLMGGFWSQTGWGLLSVFLLLFFLNPLIVGYSRWFLSNSHEGGTPGVSLLFYSFQPRIYKPIFCGTSFKLLWVAIWQYAAGLFYIPFSVSLSFAVTSVANNAKNFFCANDPQKFLENVNFFIMANIYQFFLPLTFYIIGSVGFLIVMLNRLYAYSFVEFILAENPTIGARNAMNRSKQMAYGIKRKLFLLDLSYIGWGILTILTLGLLSFGVIPYIAQTRSELYLKRKTESRFL